jgi:hypothetical protein
MNVPNACRRQTTLPIEPSVGKQMLIEALDIQWGQFHKSESTKSWDKVNSNDAFVSLKRLSRYAGLGVFKPPAEVVLQSDIGRFGMGADVKLVLNPPEFALSIALCSVDRSRFLSPFAI